MPRAKTNHDADAENGFAALDAKVEEIQVDAAIEAELAVDDVAIAAAAAAVPAPAPLAASSPAVAELSLDVRPAALLEEGPPRPAVPLNTIVSAVGEWTQSAMQFQADTFASFAGVRGPHDLLAAQIAYGARALEFYLASVARMGQASPAFWASAPGLQSSQLR